jgi:hypothetical protein
LSARCQEMEETEIILKDELEEMRKKESTMLYMREKDRKSAEVLTRQLRHMQELREFEKGIVTRAEEILVSGEVPASSMKRLGSHARLLTSRELLKSCSSTSASGITAGPVARPVLRIQGSRNLLNTSTSDSEGEEEQVSEEAEQMEMQSNPMGRPELKSKLSTEGEDTSAGKSHRGPGPRALPGRGMGRGFLRKPSAGKIMTQAPIPEEQEESSRSLNYSETSDIFDPGQSFESIQVKPSPLL